MGIQINGNTNNINAGIGSLSIEDIRELDITGVATASNFKTGISNLHDVGLTLTGGQIDVGSNIKIGTAGVITATSFVGSGANLTGLSGLSVANQADNRLITCTGTTDALNGEANFTYDGGGNLTLNSTAHDGGFNILAANNNQETRLRLQGKASDGTGHSFYLNAKRSANRLDIATASGAAITVMSTLNVGIQNAGPESPLHIGSNNQITTAKATVCVAPASGNASMTLRGGSPTIYFDGTSGGNAKFLTDGTDLTISNGTLDSAGNERFRLASGGDLTISDGNLVVANGHGINFSANTSEGGTSTATLLEDYEEGSYTITSNTNLTLDNRRTGYYTKVGNMVTVTGYLSLNTNDGSPAVSGSNNIVLSLPYAVNTSTGTYTGTMLQQNIDSDTATSYGHPLYYRSLPVDYVCMGGSDGLRFYINYIELAYTRMNNTHLHVGYPGYTYIAWNITYRTN